MKEFFVVTVSDPAPFFGDTDTLYVKGKTAIQVRERVKSTFDHPAGLHYVAVYSNADAYHKGKRPLTTYLHKCKFQS